MEGIVAENQTIWDKNYEKYVIDVLRRGKTGRSPKRRLQYFECLFLSKYWICY